MGMITVNGRSINIPDGANVSIINDVVIVNGKPWDGNEKLSGIVRVEVQGSLMSLNVERGSVEVHGDVHGNVNCGAGAKVDGNVKGSVDAGASVTCNDVGGDVDAGGSVKCGKVGGDIDAGGSVKHG